MDIFSEEVMQPMFSFLENTKNVPQRKVYHPEKDVFEHSLQTMYAAFQETNDTDLILAAMLHDIGKAVDSHKHPEVAVNLLTDYCSIKTLWLIGQHMKFWDLVTGNMQNLAEVKALLGHPWFLELTALARFDMSGRKPNKKIDYDKNKIVKKLNLAAERHFI